MVAFAVCLEPAPCLQVIRIGSVCSYGCRLPNRSAARSRWAVLHHGESNDTYALAASASFVACRVRGSGAGDECAQPVAEAASGGEAGQAQAFLRDRLP